MEDTEFLRSFIGVLGVPITAGLVQMIKPFVEDTRYYPFISLGFGLVINFVAAYALGGRGIVALVIAIFQGIMAGLAASGLYDTVHK